MIVANARGDAPPGCAFRDKTHGGSAGLPIEIIGAASVCGWAVEQGTRVERVGSDGRPEAAAKAR